MTVDCRCKGICSRHLDQAVAASPDRALTGSELYAAALARKLADSTARRTGLETANGPGFHCGRCADTFTAAARAGHRRPGVIKILNSHPALELAD